MHSAAVKQRKNIFREHNYPGTHLQQSDIEHANSSFSDDDPYEVIDQNVTYFENDDQYKGHDDTFLPEEIRNEKEIINVENIIANVGDGEKNNDYSELLKDTEILTMSSTIIDKDIHEEEAINAVREIIEFDYFSKRLFDIIDKHSNDNRCDSQLKCTGRKRNGLRTTFYYECNTCQYRQSLCSENPNTSQKMGINQASVLGTVNIGIGHTQLMELLGSMNIHCMTDTHTGYNKG